MPVFAESSHAVAMASSLMSTPVTAAPSRARLSESPPELHCRWASVLPSSLPRRARSSGKRVTPPPRRKVVRSPRWLSCAPTTAFQERRFCSRRSLWITSGFCLGGGAPLAKQRLLQGPAERRQRCPPSAADGPPGGGPRQTSGFARRCLLAGDPGLWKAPECCPPAPG